MTTAAPAETLVELKPAASDGTALRWPAERFYWAVLEAPGVRHAGALPPALRSQLHEQIPVDEEVASKLHAVCMPLAGGVRGGSARLLVCAVPREALDGLSEATLTLRPETIPGIIETADPSSEAGALNLLVGEYEPRTLRRERATLRWSLAAAIALTATLLCVGLGRRRTAAADSVRQATVSKTALLRSAGLDEASLVRELAALRSLGSAANRPTAGDAPTTLAAVLAAWPKSESHPLSLAVRPEAVTMRVEVPGDPRAFLAELTPPARFTMPEPTLIKSEKGNVLSIQLKPKETPR